MNKDRPHGTRDLDRKRIHMIYSCMHGGLGALKRTPNPTPTHPHVTDRARDCPRTDSAGSRSAQLALNLLPGPVRCVGVRWSWVWCPFQSSKSALVRVVRFTMLESLGVCLIYGFMSTRKLRSDSQAQIQTPLQLS